jgi:hypothetical protein
MGKIIISLSNEKEKELRQLAMDKYNGQRGSLSKIVDEAIDLVRHNEQKNNSKKEFEEMIKNAKDLGKIKFNRQEANYRKLFP